MNVVEPTMATEVNVKRLAEELHTAAIEKGFWDVEDALDKHVAKMHCEISEAVQADRMGNGDQPAAWCTMYDRPCAEVHVDLVKEDGEE